MATTNYTVGDTLNDKVDPVRLNTELAALSLSSCTYQGMRTCGGLEDPSSDVIVYISSDPDSGDLALLDAAVAAHTGAAVACGALVVTLDDKTVEATGFSGGSMTWEEIT